MFEYVNDPSAGSPTEHVCLISMQLYSKINANDFFLLSSPKGYFPPNDPLSNSSLLEAWTVS